MTTDLQKQMGRAPEKTSTLTTAVNDGAAAALVRLHCGVPVTDSMTIGREFGRRHGNVLASLDGLIADGTISQLDFKSAEYLDDQGKPRRAIELNERGALIAMPFIGGRNSRVGQTRLVDAFLALRQQIETPHFAIPQTMAEALRLASELAAKSDELSAIVKEQAPKVDALTRIAVADGSLSISAAAKALQIGPKGLFARLNQCGWIFKHPYGGAWRAYQSKIDRGLLEVKTGMSNAGKVFAQVLVTPKGLATLAEMLLSRSGPLGTA